MKNNPRKYAQALYESLTLAGEDNFEIIKNNFVKYLVTSNELNLWPKIAKKLQNILQKKGLVKTINIITATETNMEQKNHIESILGEKSLINYSIKPEIIGGVQIIINDEQKIDASLASKINKLF